MAAKKWVKFPHSSAAFDYSGAKLAKAWDRLHAGDQEAFPDKKHVAALQKRHPKLKEAGDAEAIAEALQEAWRDFHRGDFQKATEIGEGLGVIGATVANKAEGIYATYLAKETDRGAHFERCHARVDLPGSRILRVPRRHRQVQHHLLAGGMGGIRHAPGEWRMRQDRAGDGTRQARGALTVRQAVAEVVDDDADRHPFSGLARGRRGSDDKQEEQGDADHQRESVRVFAPGRWRCP